MTKANGNFSKTNYKTRLNYQSGSKRDVGHCGTRQNRCLAVGDACLDCFMIQGKYTKFEEKGETDVTI